MQTTYWHQDSGMPHAIRIAETLGREDYTVELLDAEQIEIYAADLDGDGE